MERESVNTGPGSAWQARPLSSAQLCTILMGQEALRMRAESDGVWPLPQGTRQNSCRTPVSDPLCCLRSGLSGSPVGMGLPHGECRTQRGRGICKARREATASGDGKLPPFPHLRLRACQGYESPTDADRAVPFLLFLAPRARNTFLLPLSVVSGDGVCCLGGRSMWTQSMVWFSGMVSCW